MYFMSDMCLVSLGIIIGAQYRYLELFVCVSLNCSVLYSKQLFSVWEFKDDLAAAVAQA